MGQESNSGRRASLDERKERAAGRRHDQHAQPDQPPQVAGAFGSGGQPNAKARRGGAKTKGAGGGGASQDHAEKSTLLDAPEQTRKGGRRK